MSTIWLLALICDPGAMSEKCPMYMFPSPYTVPIAAFAEPMDCERRADETVIEYGYRPSQLYCMAINLHGSVPK